MVIITHEAYLPTLASSSYNMDPSKFKFAIICGAEFTWTGASSMF